MAPPMRCPAHGTVSGEGCDVPGCFEPLQPDVDEPSAPAEACAAPECGMPLPCPLHPARAAQDAGQREVDAYLATADPRRQNACAPAAADGTELRFPWGPVRVADGGLTIGRDYTAQCGPEIDDFTNVSRRHAEITTRDGQLFIEDQASTNGTTVNGSQIPPYQPQPLVDGDVVGFGARLRVIVSTRKPNQ